MSKFMEDMFIEVRKKKEASPLLTELEEIMNAVTKAVYDKSVVVEREKKRQRRLAKEGVVDAVEKGVKPENNQPKHSQVEKGEISAETSDSDSVVESGEVKAKINKPKKKSKKTNKKT